MEIKEQGVHFKVKVLQKNYEQRCREIQKTLGDISENLVKDDLIELLRADQTSSEFILDRIQEIIKKYLNDDRERQFQDLMCRNCDLEQNNESKDREIQHLTKKLANYKQEIQDLQSVKKELMDTQFHIQKSEKLVNEFEMMSESYKKKIKELEFENKELKMIEVKDQSTLKRKYIEMEQEYQNLKLELQSLQKIQDQKNRITDEKTYQMEEHCRKQEMRISEFYLSEQALNNLVEGKSKQIIQLQESVQRFEKLHKTQNDEIQSLQHQIFQLNQAKDRIQIEQQENFRTIKQGDKAIEFHKNIEKQKDEQIQLLNKKIIEMQAYQGILNNDIQQLQLCINNKQKEINEQSVQEGKLRCQIEHLENSSNDKSQQVDLLNNTVLEKERQKNEFEKIQLTLEKQNVKLQCIIKQSEKEKSIIQKKLFKAKNIILKKVTDFASKLQQIKQDTKQFIVQYQTQMIEILESFPQRVNQIMLPLQIQVQKYSKDAIDKTKLNRNFQSKIIELEQDIVSIKKECKIEIKSNREVVRAKYNKLKNDLECSRLREQKLNQLNQGLQYEMDQLIDNIEKQEQWHFEKNQSRLQISKRQHIQERPPTDRQVRNITGKYDLYDVVTVRHPQQIHQKYLHPEKYLKRNSKVPVQQSHSSQHYKEYSEDNKENSYQIYSQDRLQSQHSYYSKKLENLDSDIKRSQQRRLQLQNSNYSLQKSDRSQYTEDNSQHPIRNIPLSHENSINREQSIKYKNNEQIQTLKRYLSEDRRQHQSDDSEAFWNSGQDSENQKKTHKYSRQSSQQSIKSYSQQ